MSRFVALALVLTSLLPAAAHGGSTWVEMYSGAQLIGEQPRFERFIGKLYAILQDAALQPGSDGDSRAIAAARLKFPLPDGSGSPLNFYSSPSGPTVFM